MRDLAAALALVFVLEGLYYAIAPEKVQSLMRELIKLPPEQLRKAGLIVATVGAIWIYLIRK